jgi:NADPH:quinone reductase-like Zn-dependent oxidoreductase
MMEPRNRVIQVSRFGDPEGMEVVDAPLPTAGRGEVRVRVLASSLNYTEVLIRRHLYPQTMRLRPPFVMGYSVNAMRARHPTWFKEDLEQLFGLLATGAIRPRVADWISFDEVAGAHRRLEAGGLLGKLVLCPDLPSRPDRVPLRLDTATASKESSTMQRVS